MKKFFLALAIIGVSLIFFGFVVASQPTKMSLQGKVEGLSNGDLGVKISDQNSCLDGVFFDHNYTVAIQDSTFNLLLGDLDQLNLNYNQDYWLCLYVNGSLVDGPNNFRGGQGQIGLENIAGSFGSGDTNWQTSWGIFDANMQSYYLDISRNLTQTITGMKIFSSTALFSSGILIPDGQAVSFGEEQQIPISSSSVGNASLVFSTGYFANIADGPTNSVAITNICTLNTSQTFSGAKTFSANPTISNIKPFITITDTTTNDDDYVLGSFEDSFLLRNTSADKNFFRVNNTGDIAGMKTVIKADGNLTMYSPNGTPYNCGVTNGGVFQCT